MSDPIVITTRSQIRSLAARFAASYPHEPEMCARMAALDPERATPADVAGIFRPQYRHDGKCWIETACECCGEDRGLVVRLGEEPDYESRTLFICVPCLEAALALAKAAA